MKEFLLNNGVSFDEVSKKFDHIYGTSNVMTGVMGKVFKFIMTNDFTHSLILPQGVNNNILHHLTHDGLSIKMLENQIRLDLKDGRFLGKLRLQENSSLGKFTTIVSLNHNDCNSAVNLNTVLSRCDLANVAVRFTIDNELELIADGLNGFCNLFNFIASYKECMQYNTIKIIKPLRVEALV